MNKAHELIDTPEKWSGDIREIGPGRKYCAYTAILDTYGREYYGDHVADKLRGILGVSSIVDWNDHHDWKTVYGTLKEHDI